MKCEEEPMDLLETAFHLRMSEASSFLPLRVDQQLYHLCHCISANKIMKKLLLLFEHSSEVDILLGTVSQI